MDFVVWNSHDAAHLAAFVHLWNDACGAEFPITEKFARYNAQSNLNAVRVGQFARMNDELVGCVLVSASTQFKTCWIDVLVVSPKHQRQGIGSALLAWADEWTRAQAFSQLRLGGGLHPFFSGLPSALHTRGFFETRGFRITRSVFDVARRLPNVSGFRKPDTSRLAFRAATHTDADALAQFLLNEFSERWQYEFLQAQNDGEPITDYCLLITDNCIIGFARITLESSARPIERFYMQHLPRPHGQLGPLGIAKNFRGQGYGLQLIDMALQHLGAQGVKGCVIDWTDLVELYAKFGFTPYHEFLVMVKDVT